MTKENKRINKFILSITSWKFRFFLIFKLPLAYIAGLKIQKISPRKAIVSVPFSFWNKNPFNSMYFAVQAMAAELSTGSLVFLHADGKNISMLVTALNSKYYKKAITKINFICLDGGKIASSIKQAVDTGDATICRMVSKGYDLKGDCVSEFEITWSLKKRNSIK